MIADTYEHAGVTVEIHYDETPEHADPRDYDNLSVLYCWHPRYKLGDEQFTQSDHDSMTEVVEYLRTERKAVVIVPLFLYDHSGISISAGRALDLLAWSQADIEARDRFVGDAAGWDTTHVGFAYVTLERAEELGVGDAAKKEGENLLDVFERQLREEVTEYDLFLTGQVYGYVVGEDTPFEESCWGFLGDEHVKEEANSAADNVRARLDAETKEAAEMAARDIVTVCDDR